MGNFYYFNSILAAGQLPFLSIMATKLVLNVASLKFLLNLCVGAAVLPISSLLMQNGYEFNTIFILMGGMAVFILLAALILPNQTEVDRLDKIY